MATTQPGGFYIVGGKGVDANGNEAKSQRRGAGAEDAFDVETATLEELKAEAERQGLDVERAEGEGAPRKADYQAALRA